MFEDSAILSASCPSSAYDATGLQYGFPETWRVALLVYSALCSYVFAVCFDLNSFHFLTLVMNSVYCCADSLLSNLHVKDWWAT